MTSALITSLHTRWIECLLAHRLLMSEETRIALRDAENRYVFAHQRERHRMIYGRRAFPERAQPERLGKFVEA